MRIIPDLLELNDVLNRFWDFRWTQLQTFSELVSDIKLLLDVAHLKVSAATLNFDPLIAIGKWKPFIEAVHLSDNDGMTDSNKPFTNGSWFWPFLKDLDCSYTSIEVNNQTISGLKEQIQCLKANFANYKKGRF
jgi:sugar phosphate isomerase/epimerase